MPDDVALEVTLTAKGQITLPRKLRERMGLSRGSRIRLRVDARGRLWGDPILHDLDDLWAMADEAGRPKRSMTRDEMDTAKAKRRW